MPQRQKIPWNESICQNANSANTTPKLVYTMTGLSNTKILPQTPQQTAVQDNHEITERSRKRAGADYRDIYIKTLLKAINKIYCYNREATETIEQAYHKLIKAS